MAMDETAIPASQGSVGQNYTLSLNANELQVIQMALGELLQTVRRDEHLIPTIERLLQRLKTTSPNA